MATESTKDPTSTYVIAAGWYYPTRAYTSNNSRTYTANTTSYQGYGDYGFSFTDETITKVEIGLEGYHSDASPSYIRCFISWDGGTSWGSAHYNYGTSEDIQWFDVTAETTWTAAKLNDTNLKTKIHQYKPTGCLIKGSLILTPDGYKKIEDLNVGDMVIGNENGKEVYTRIIAKTSHLLDTIVFRYKGIGFEADHKVFIGKEWKNVFDLQKKGKEYKGMVYNIETEVQNFYGKNKLLIHNLTKT